MRKGIWRAWLMPVAAIAALAAACDGGGTAGTGSAPGDTPLSPEAALGEKIFADPSLSASGRQSCASCHDPAHAHSPASNFAAEFGGPNGDLQGKRRTPGIRYLATNTQFFFAADGTPTGGFFWDGREPTLAGQATEPFLNPFEMANAGKAAVIARLAAAPYAGSEVRRPAARLPRQRQHARRAVQPPARRRTGAFGRRDRRRHRLLEDAERRLRALIAARARRLPHHIASPRTTR